MSRFGLTAKVDTQKQVVNVSPVNNINVSVRSPSDIQEGAIKEKEVTTTPVEDSSNPYADIYITPTEANMTALKTRLGE